MKTVKKLIGAALVVAAFVPTVLQAASVTMTLDTLVNGGMPGGTLTATFVDTGVGEVTLTMTNNLVLDEFDVYWMFNLDPYPNPLTVSYVSGQAYESYITGPSEGSNAIQGGLFDFGFQFVNSNNSPDRFTPGETSVYKFVGLDLDALDFFDFSTESNSGTFGWLSAARIQGIAGQPGSGSIGTTDGTIDDDEEPNPAPEPGSLALAGLALAGLAIARRRRV